MSFSSAARTDMVISMTLAELFLMLLFVVWYGYSPVYSEAARARLSDRIAELEKELEPARKNAELVREKEALLDWWRTQDPERAKHEGKTLPGTEGGGPGAPRCDPSQNVLVEADFRQGQISMRVLTRHRIVEESLGSGVPYPPTGVWLTDPAIVQGFLGAIRTQNLQAPCRGHYRLYYETKIDYFDGRELFEKVFYPARIVLAPPPA